MISQGLMQPLARRMFGPQLVLKETKRYTQFVQSFPAEKHQCPAQAAGSKQKFKAGGQLPLATQMWPAHPKDPRSLSEGTQATQTLALA